MSKFLFAVICVAAVSLLSACNTMTTTGPVAVEASSRWAIFPINNYSTTPKANNTLATLVETELRSRGVSQLQTFQQQKPMNLVSLLENSPDNARLLAKARSMGFRYGITGSVHEWHYKSGPDREPAVGVSLKVIDLVSSQVVWQGSTSRTGWVYANLSSVADKAIQDLLKQVKFPR